MVKQIKKLTVLLFVAATMSRPVLADVLGAFVASDL